MKTVKNSKWQKPFVYLVTPTLFSGTKFEIVFLGTIDSFQKIHMSSYYITVLEFIVSFYLKIKATVSQKV